KGADCLLVGRDVVEIAHDCLPRSELLITPDGFLHPPDLDQLTHNQSWDLTAEQRLELDCHMLLAPTLFAAEALLQIEDMGVFANQRANVGRAIVADALAATAPGAHELAKAI